MKRLSSLLLVLQTEDVLKEEVATNEAIGGRGRCGYSGRR